METLSVSKAAQSALPSGIRKMFEKANQYEDTINLSIGEPGFTTPKPIIEVAVSNLRAGKTKYTSNAGIVELRNALAKKMYEENGIKCDPDKNIIVTAGATQALMLALTTLVNPGDEVIIPDPAWPDYLGQVQMVNATPVYAPLKEDNEFKMTADVIEPLITDKTKLIMLNSPSNPTGAVLDENELREIAEMIKKHKVFIISDEPYEKLLYDDNKHFSLASLDGIEDYVLTINSFSKTFAMTGWRVGYAVGNETIISNMIKLHENMIASINEAFQLAAVSALEVAEEDVAMMRDYYDKNRKLVVEGLNKINGFSCIMPRGAFYAFPNITGFNMSSEEVANMILDKTGVITAPGSAFGAAGEGFLRISYANDTESIIEALKRLENEFGLKE
ncbi:pyridoxal phosphate-dependent aminotransferase [Enterococcus avium]